MLRGVFVVVQRATRDARQRGSTLPGRAARASARRTRGRTDRARATAVTIGCSGGSASLTPHADRGGRRAPTPTASRRRAPASPVRPMRAFSVARSSSISTQPAMPADAVSPAAPHVRRQSRAAAAAESRTDSRARSSARRGRSRSAAASACRAARSRSTSRAGRASTPAARPPIRRGCPRRRPRRRDVKRPVCSSAAAIDVAEREKRHRRRHDEERDLPQAGVEPPPQRLRAAGVRRRDRPDIAGSSAAATDMPNRLTGSV